MQGKDNIENLLRKSADNLANEFQDDWAVFDKKLAQAKSLKRLKRITAGSAVAAALVFLFMAFNGYQMFWEKDAYIPRTQDVVFENLFEDEPSDFNSKSQNRSIGINKPHESEELNNSSPNLILPNTSIENNEKKEAIYNSEPLNKGVEIAQNSEENQFIRSSSPLEDENQGPLVSQAEKGAKINRELNPKEDLIFLKTNRGFGQIKSGSTLETKSNNAGKYLNFQVTNIGNSSGGSEILLPLKSPIEQIDFSKIKTGPYISPLQAKNAWSYSINMYPNYTFRKFELDEDKGNLLHADFADAVQAAESGGLSLNLGFEVNRRIGAVTYFNTGIEYISYKTEVLYNFTNFRDPIINKHNGFIDGYTLKSEAEKVNFSDKNIYHYVNLPFSISYQPWASDHVRLNIEAGASFLYFMAANGQTLDYKTLDIVDLSERDFRNSMGSFSMKIGANYYVNERINIGFEPTLMYFTNTIYEDDYPFYVIPYSVGLNFNLQVKLN